MQKLHLIPAHRTVEAADRELAKAVEHGDESAFRELYRRHTPRLYRHLLRLLASSADAEEVTQETWVRAARHLPGFRWQSRFDTWLLGIGRNLCLETLRARQRRAARESSAAEAQEHTTHGSAPSRPIGLRLDLERAIALLPDGCRAVLVLHDIEGFTHQEIAHQLDIATGTSKSQLSEARRRLRQLLGPKEIDHAPQPAALG